MEKRTVSYRIDGTQYNRGFRIKLPIVEREEENTPTPDIEVYEGPYVVRPTPAGRILDTEGKRMTDDITIQPIPYYEVSNGSGGETVYIGV